MRRLLTRPAFTIPVALVVFIALAVVVKLSVWQAPLTAYGGTADVEQKMWFFTWTPFAITSHRNPFLSTFINYPTGINMTWNTPMPAIGVLFWPVTAVWGAIVSYNLVTTLSMALAALFAYLAIRRYVRGELAAAIGGLLFGFSPAMISQNTGHASPVVSMVMVPLTLILVDEVLVRQRMRWWLLGLLIAALGILQFYTFEEFFVFDVGAAALLALIFAVMFRDQIRSRRAYVLRSSGLAVLVTFLAIVYPLYLQFAGPDRPAHSLHDPNGFSTDLLNLVIPTGVQWIAPSFATHISSPFSGNSTEANAYLGIPLLVLAVVVVVRHWRFTVVRAAGLMALIMTILSLGPDLHVAGHLFKIPLPWWLPGHVPFLRSLIPSRMMAYAVLAVAVLLAFGLHRLWAARRNVVLTGLAFALVVAPLLPTVPLLSSTLHVPSYFSTAAVKEIPEGTAVLAVPWPGVTAMDAMDWQVASHMRFRLLGGYFIGPAAAEQDALFRVATSFQGPGDPGLSPQRDGPLFLQQLHDSHVGAVLVGPVPLRSSAVSFLTGVLGPPDTDTGTVAVWLLKGA